MMHSEHNGERIFQAMNVICIWTGEVHGGGEETETNRIREQPTTRKSNKESPRFQLESGGLAKS